MPELNQWGDPVNTVYLVMMDNALERVFKCWKAANDYAEKKNIAAIKRGEPENFWVCPEPMF